MTQQRSRGCCAPRACRPLPWEVFAVRREPGEADVLALQMIKRIEPIDVLREVNVSLDGLPRAAPAHQDRG